MMALEEIMQAKELVAKIKSLPQKLWASQEKAGEKQRYPYYDEMVDASGGYGYYSIVVYMVEGCEGIIVSCSEPTLS